MLAERHYAQGWPPHPLSEQAFEHLERAKELYPFMRRFREGPMLRMKLVIERGI